jgi:RNA polymerase sigma-70 factor (ECF subfamily)
VERPGASDDFDEFFAATYESVRRLLVVVLGDREGARDIAQDAYVRALIHWRRVSGYEQPFAWVRKVAVRLAIRSRTRNARFFELVKLQGTAPNQDLSTAESADDWLDLAAALEELSPAQRAAVALHYLDDLPVVDVARILGCAEATARVHLHRGRERLRRLLG